MDSNLSELFRRLERVTASGDTAQRCQGVKDILVEDLGGKRVTVPEEFLQPVASGYARRRLFLESSGRFSVVVMVWAPGQGTPIHDHAGHWCVECVYMGRIQVTSYEREREDDGKIYFRQHGTTLAGVGAAGALIPPFEYHTISNPYDTTAVTVHVYERELTWCHAFTPLEPAGWYRPERHDLVYSAG